MSRNGKALALGLLMAMIGLVAAGCTNTAAVLPGSEM